MHFTVKAADKKTGQERSIGLTADSEAEVRQWAQSQGLLVSSITADGEVPIATRADAADPHNITGNATILQIVGSILIAIATLAIMGGIAVALLTQLQIGSFILAAYVAGFGVVMLALGAMLRMLAAIGPTLRDIARR